MRLPVLSDLPAPGSRSVDLVNALLRRVDGGTVGLRLHFEMPGEGECVCVLTRGSAHGEFAALPVRISNAVVTLDGASLEPFSAPAVQAGAIEITLTETGGKRAVFVGQGLEIQWFPEAAKRLE